MSQRLNISSGSPYEPIGGFSRAVRLGNFVSVAGTAPIAEDGKPACPGDPAGQTRRCLAIIQNALEDAGASLSDVVRTRLLLTRITDWKEIMAAHGEFFKDVRPASTVMEVSALIDPEWLIEIEADAVIS